MRYLLLAGSMVLAVIGQLFLKKGINASALTPDFIVIVKTLFSPLVLIGFVSYGISSIIWLFVLQKFPLSIAYPALSITYVVIIILSFFLFKEPLTYFKIAGVFFIIFGVFILFK